MATITKFEDIRAWQKAKELVKSIYKLANTEPIRNDFGYRDQLTRASVSVMNNIAEGFGRGGTREIIQFLRIARGSLAETQSMIYVGQEIGYIHSDRAEELQKCAREVTFTIASLSNYLREHLKTHSESNK
jgi:four helix bundle protein